jgi:hypothetical protein
MYCSIADVRAFDSRITEAAYDDNTVTAAINLAGSIIDNMTGQWFEERELTLTLTGRGLQDLMLIPPAIEITTVTVNDEELDSDNYKLVATDPKRYRFLRYISGTWTDGDEIAITGKFGFVDISDDDPPVITVPLIAKRLCMIIVVGLLLKSSDSETLISETIGDYSYRKDNKSQTFFGSREAYILLSQLTPPWLGVI